MANISKITEHSTKSVHIFDGKYIVLGLELPIIDHPGLLKPNRVFNNTGFQLLGCKFPNSQKNEPQPTDEIDGNIHDKVASLLKNKTELYKLVFNSNVTNITSTQPRTVKYKSINGLIYNSNGDTKLLNTIETGFYPVYEPDPTQTYFIYNEEVYTLRLLDDGFIPDPEKPELIVPKYGISLNPLDFSDEQKDIIAGELKVLANDAIRLDSLGTSPTLYDNVEIDSKLAREGIVEINSSITLNIRIEGVILKENNVSDYVLKEGNIITDTITGDINREIIDSGYAAFINNGASIVSNITVSDSLSANLNGYLNILSDARVVAVNNETGIWANDYWKNTIRDDDYPSRLSYSAFNTYLDCSFRYYMSAVQDNRYISDDKVSGFVGMRKGAVIFGQIAHRHGEKIVVNRILNKGAELNNIDEFIRAGISHIMGQNLDLDPYDSFDIADAQTLTVKQQTEYINLLSDLLKNVNTRNYMKGFDTSATEYALEGTTFEILDEDLGIVKKKFNITGFVDGIVYNSNTNKLTLFDLKTNKNVYRGPKSGSNITSSPDIYKIMQLVFYLAAIARKGKIGDGPGEIVGPLPGVPATTDAEIIDVLSDPNIETFYDFMRFDESAGKFEITPEQRVQIWNEIIKPGLESLADSLISYQNTGAPGNLQKTKTTNCNNCYSKEICPVYRGIDGDLALYGQRISTKKRPKPIVDNTILQKIIRNNMDHYLPYYIKYATEGLKSSDLSLLDKRTKEVYLKRKSAIKGTDNIYKTQIGATYLSASVTSISLVDSKRHGYSRTLRSMHPTVHRVPGADKQAIMRIRFDNAKSINSELRHIMAQCYATTYISIRNAELSRSLLPFDTNKDIYGAISDPEMINLIKYYLRSKGLDNNHDYGYDLSQGSPSELKNRIYARARLFYSITELFVTAVPDMTDTVDLTLRVQLLDTTVVSTTGGIEYLTDTHPVFIQLSKIYNSNIEQIYLPNTVSNAVYEIYKQKQVSFVDTTGSSGNPGNMSILVDPDLTENKTKTIAGDYLVDTKFNGAMFTIDNYRKFINQTKSKYNGGSLFDIVCDYILTGQKYTGTFSLGFWNTAITKVSSVNISVLKDNQTEGHRIIAMPHPPNLAKKMALNGIYSFPRSVDIFDGTRLKDMFSNEIQFGVFKRSKINNGKTISDIPIALWLTGKTYGNSYGSIMRPVYYKYKRAPETTGIIFNSDKAPITNPYMLTSYQAVSLTTTANQSFSNAFVTGDEDKSFSFGQISSRYGCPARLGEKGKIGDRLEWEWLRLNKSQYPTTIKKYVGEVGFQQLYENVKYYTDTDISVSEINIPQIKIGGKTITPSITRISIENGLSGEDALIDKSNNKFAFHGIHTIGEFHPSGIFGGPKFEQRTYNRAFVDIITLDVVSNDGLKHNFLSFPFIKRLSNSRINPTIKEDDSDATVLNIENIVDTIENKVSAGSSGLKLGEGGLGIYWVSAFPGSISSYYNDVNISATNKNIFT